MEENRFKKFRMEKNPNIMEDFTAKDLSKEIGIAAPKISELENGRRNASLSELKAYHKYFNVPYEYLLGESKSRHYENMALSDELGLTGDSIEHLKTIYKRFKSNADDIPEGRELRTINYLLEHWDTILYNIGCYLDSALCDADRVQAQYVTVKYHFDTKDQPIVKLLDNSTLGLQIDDLEYEQFCEIHLQRVISLLREQWKHLHKNYLKKAPNTN